MAAGALPDWRVFVIAILYSAGAHGIMTLNDFKAINGDRQLGIRTLPVQLGPVQAARFACAVMAAAQLWVVALLLVWSAHYYALAVLIVLLIQLILMRRLLRDPMRFAPWYNATGISLYVTGMLISAFALRAMPVSG